MNQKSFFIKKALLSLAPIMLGVAPFGLVTGMSYINNGFTITETVLSSVIVFAGSSQIAIMHLISQDAPLWVIAATTGIINFRLMLYSASISEYWKVLPRKLRLFQAFFLTDQAYAVSLLEYRKRIKPIQRVWFYCTFAILMYLLWVLFTFLGALVGNYIPKSFGIELVLPLVFLTVLIPMVTDYYKLISVIVGAIMLIFLYDLPHHLGMLIAIIAAIVIGSAVEYKFKPKNKVNE